MRRFYLFAPALLLCLVSCMKEQNPGTEDGTFSPVQGQSLFVVNEGSFGSGNSSLSCYDAVSQTVTNGVFSMANGVPLGDTGQSMTIHGDNGWVVVNNSKIIFAVGLSDMKEKGRITGLTSPRNIAFVSDTKAYVTDLYDTKITIVNPQTYQVTGWIETEASTEQMIISDGYMYVNCWSYGTEILKIDLASDAIVKRIKVGIQPCSMALDSQNRLWVLTDGGGWKGNPAGYEKPGMSRIGLNDGEVDAEWEFDDYTPVSDLTVSSDGNTLYWLRSGVCKMNINATDLPSEPLIPNSSGQTFYSLTVSPSDGDIYVGDAIDYSQNGKVYRYSADGTLKSEFSVGICPGAFCWY